MEPLFFGPPESQLFGVYHPASERRSTSAVVLCSAGPQEYMTTHWANRRLATSLSKAGVHVLRFDYFGVGDSAGSSEDGTLEEWEQNIHAATEALRTLANVDRVSWIGYRLGASLAWRASLAGASRPRDLVLWDPVIDGRAYLRDLQAADRAYASRLLYFPPSKDPIDELYGFPLPAAQRTATEALDLLSEPLPRATRVHTYVSRETPMVQRLTERLGAQLKRFSYQYVPEEGAHGSGNLLSSRILRTITDALAPGAPA